MSRKPTIRAMRDNADVALTEGFRRIGQVVPGILTTAEGRAVIMEWANGHGYMILPDSIVVGPATAPDEGTWLAATVRKFEGDASRGGGEGPGE